MHDAHVTSQSTSSQALTSEVFLPGDQGKEDSNGSFAVPLCKSNRFRHCPSKRKCFPRAWILDTFPPIPLLVPPSESATQDSVHGASLMGSCERSGLFSLKEVSFGPTNTLASKFQTLSLSIDSLSLSLYIYI